MIIKLRLEDDCRLREVASDENIVTIKNVGDELQCAAIYNRWTITVKKKLQ